MALVDVGVVFGEEEVVDGELVGLADEVGDLGEDFGAGAVGGAFEVVGDGEEHGWLWSVVGVGCRRMAVDVKLENDGVYVTQ